MIHQSGSIKLSSPSGRLRIVTANESIRRVKDHLHRKEQVLARKLSV